MRVGGWNTSGHRRTVATCIFGHIQLLQEALHKWSGDGRARNDAGAQVRGIEIGRLGNTENGLEHRGHTVEGGTFFIGNGVQHGLGVEGLTGENNLGAVSDDGQHAQDQPEAVEEWWRAAENVEGGQVHAIADEARIVDKVTAESALSISPRTTKLTGESTLPPWGYPSSRW